MTEKFLLMNAVAKTTKTGNTYFDLTLSNREEKIAGKYWSGSPDLTEFVGSVLEISGSRDEFNGEAQFKVQSFEVTGEDPSQFCKASKYDIEQMYAGIMKLVDSCQNEELRGILTDIFEEYGDEFKKHSAALKVHHAFVGGLLQHTFCVATAASRLCSVYPGADRDVVVTAALLHDIGKLDELSKFPTLEYTRLGNCVGHTTLSVMLVSKYIGRITDSLVMDKLLNCIASHHGRLEWGAPAVPACVEACIVHVSDLLDSRVEIIMEASENLETGKMSGYLNTIGGAVIGV